ncbi:unnamed protein product [Gadus morhua 'NCC']
MSFPEKTTQVRNTKPQWPSGRAPLERALLDGALWKGPPDGPLWMGPYGRALWTGPSGLGLWTGPPDGTIWRGPSG